ncbi:hypothetical protein BDU57DRAFT_181992 [Ampelomyces quisqualis]|uniref:HD/PDEase domain-containing protein n=1 Tax=Ampelomyces quisqualis TaxID=50730 RepID=A0A6A5QQC5_AMPQU|nr:hypothetical protein BDU57DRAFT_181992 [Ampelomyces quisqualis]
MAPFGCIPRRLSNLFSLKSRSTSSSVGAPTSSNHTLQTSGSDARLYPLLDPERLGISSQHRDMFKGVNQAVMAYAASPTFDASHNYLHLQRAVMLAHKIYQEHKDDHWVLDVNPVVMYIACLVHEIGQPQHHVRDQHDERDQEDIIRDFLKANGCRDPLVYSGAAFVAVRVSLECELEDQQQIKADCNNYPALRIVQDAVRLDRLGAVGIGRCFAQGGLDKEQRDGAGQNGVELCYETFGKYVELMKTKMGRNLGKERLEFMEKFCEHWMEETNCAMVL